MTENAFPAWQRLLPDSDEFLRIDEALFPAYPAERNPERSFVEIVETIALPCHPGVVLARIGLRQRHDRAYALVAPHCVVYAAGCPQDIYTLNLWVPPQLDDDAAAAAYLRLWLEISRGTEDERPIETPNDLAWAARPTAEREDAAARLIAPIEIDPPDEHKRRVAHARMRRAGEIALLTLVLWPDGLVQVKRTETLLSDPILAAPDPIVPFSELRDTPIAAHPVPTANGAALALEGILALNGDTPYDGLIDLNDLPPNLTEPPENETDAGNTDWNLGRIFDRLAASLIRAALRRAAPPRRSKDAEAWFFDYLGKFRPTVLIETPYRELRGEIARFVADGCGFPVNQRLEGGPSTPAYAMNCLTDRPEVVLLTEASFQRTPEGNEIDAGAMLSPVIRGPHVALIVVENLDSLPQDVRDTIDFNLAMPRMDEDMFWEATAALFGRRPRRRKADWVRYVLPRDMARMAAATRDLPRYLDELEATIRRRLAQYTVADAPSLGELRGLGEARQRIEDLAADIRAALKGGIGWNQVDRGYLLVGPPGTGKTTLVRALARDCGVRFILASASRWQEQTSLGPHIQSIRSTFREARLYAPAILFIDEIDSLGSRVRTEAANSQYQTVVINTVLEELQGFETRDGIIVIGATNAPENVDEALRRPGRLDRIVPVPYPNVAALASIYGFYLERAARDGMTIGEIDTQRLAQLSFGRTGAHVELFVRGAARRARRAGREILTETDVIDEIVARPSQGFGIDLAPEAMRRVAVHEAGHALVAMTGPQRNQDIPMISIIPRSDGSLGFVARSPNEARVETRDDMEEGIRILLGGRAAEELVYGGERISGGSGGGGASDLAYATRSILRLLTAYGFSRAGGLLWIDWYGRDDASQVTTEAIRNLPIGDDILNEARSTADRLYGETLDRLTHRRDVLDRLVAALIERQEMSAAELRALIDA